MGNLLWRTLLGTGANKAQFLFKQIANTENGFAKLISF